MTTQIIKFEEIDGGKILRLSLDIQSFSDYEDFIDIYRQRNLGSDAMLAEMLEYQLCNGWDFLDCSEFAMTGAPALTQETLRNVSGNFVNVGTFWYYSDYAVYNPIEVMLKHGHVDFTRYDMNEEEQAIYDADVARVELEEKEAEKRDAAFLRAYEKANRSMLFSDMHRANEEYDQFEDSIDYSEEPDFLGY